MKATRTLAAIFAATVAGLATTSASAGVPGYYRFPTVNGEQIAFSSEGDLWKVSTSGGVAMRLTSHPAGEHSPKFSPDGKQIAFTAGYEGNDDIYVMSSDGGEPKRLTFHPSGETTVGWTPDGKHVMFRARREGAGRMDTLYKVPVDGGQPEKINIGAAAVASYSADQKKIAFNPFIWGGTWKRYKGGTAPKIWVGDLETNKFWKLADHEHVDQFPLFVGDRIYFLSERVAPVSIWSSNIDGSDARQLTNHNDYDVRGLDTDGKKLVYNVGADIYLMGAPAANANAGGGGSSPSAMKVEITLPTDRIRERPRSEDASKTIDSYDISADGKRFVVASRGEIWNAPAKPGGRIIQVTPGDSAIRQRAATFSPDGKQILCITDETGEQELALYDAAGKKPHKLLTKNATGWVFPPIWSDDSKQIAFSDLSGKLFVVNPESGETKVIDHDKNWEITEYTFSPDSKWLAYTKYGDNRVQSIYLYELATGKSTPVSGGFTSDYNPAWDASGKYLYFLSNRVFNPFLDDLDREFLVTKTAKPCAVILAKDGKSPFLPEELLGEDKDGDDKKDEKKSDGDSTTKPSDEKGEKGDDAEKDEKESKGKKKPVNVKIDLDGIRQRVVEFPVGADNCGFLAAGEGKVYWVTTPTRGLAEEEHDNPAERRRYNGKLNMYDLKERKHEVLLENIHKYTLSRDGKKMAWQKGKDVFVADAGKKPGNDVEEKLALRSLPLEVSPADEWKQIFAEAWRLQRDFYWAENMVGVDWPEMRKRYEVLLDRVSTRGELNDVIGQLIGELGTSHTYVFGGDNAFLPPNPTPVGVLGADVELDKETGLFRFVKVFRPEVWETDIEAPLTMSHANVKTGDYLLAVNGRELKPTDSVDAKFTNLAGVLVQLTVCSKPDKSDARDVDVETLKSDAELRYADWCRANREYVDEKTSGKVGYFHIPDMGGEGLVKFIEGFYPQYNKDALIIDDRHNGGGFVSQMIIEKLNRKVWAYDRPRRGLGGTYPERAHVGHKCVLINEHAGSDGDIFPDSFRTLGLGPLIGKRTWGGVVGIRMDKNFVDNGMSSQPEFAWWDAKRGWSLENRGVEPDIEVEYRPEDYVAGRDPQLDRGIEEMLKALKDKPVQRPQPPKFPVRVPQPTADNR